jgi:hypothetical protein
MLARIPDLGKDFSVLCALERQLGRQLQLANRCGNVQLQQVLARPWALLADFLRRKEGGHGEAR